MPFGSVRIKPNFMLIEPKTVRVSIAFPLKFQLSFAFFSSKQQKCV
jgi:hypothetical protein